MVQALKAVAVTSLVYVVATPIRGQVCRSEAATPSLLVEHSSITAQRWRNSLRAYRWAARGEV
jgi:hypothetical protein